MLKTLFTRRWIFATLLAIIAVAVMIRLGIWQLERLQERRAFNARVTAQIDQPALTLMPQNFNVDLTNMEYRPVVVAGMYDDTQEIALRNRAYENHLGVDLLTPLIISGTQQAVLVNRGWIPTEQAAPDNWVKFTQPGIIEVRGVIRRSQERADFGVIGDPAGPLKVWNLVNLNRIQEQMPYSLLPVYIERAPESTGLNDATSPTRPPFPIPNQIALDLSEGPHLGYALQWFIFATILGLGYPVFVHARMNAQR